MSVEFPAHCPQRNNTSAAHLCSLDSTAEQTSFKRGCENLNFEVLAAGRHKLSVLPSAQHVEQLLRCVLAGMGWKLLLLLTMTLCTGGPGTETTFFFKPQHLLHNVLLR